MSRAIDTLASEYGWSKTHILEEIYPDEVFELQELILERHRANYLMQLAIVHNPYSDEPQQLWDELRGTQDFISSELDREGMEHFKTALSASANIAVKSKA